MSFQNLWQNLDVHFDDLIEFCNEAGFKGHEATMYREYVHNGNLTLLTKDMLEKMARAFDGENGNVLFNYERAVVAYNIRARLNDDQMNTLTHDMSNPRTVKRWLEEFATMSSATLEKFETYFGFDPRVPNNVLMAPAKRSAAERDAPAAQISKAENVSKVLGKPTRAPQLVRESDDDDEEHDRAYLPKKSGGNLKSLNFIDAPNSPFTQLQYDRAPRLEACHDEIVDTISMNAHEHYHEIANSAPVRVMLELWPNEFSIDAHGDSNAPTFEVSCEIFSASITSHSVTVSESRRDGGNYSLSRETDDYSEGASRILDFFNTLSGEHFTDILVGAGFQPGDQLLAENKVVVVETNAYGGIDNFFTPNSAFAGVHRDKSNMTNAAFLRRFGTRLRGVQISTSDSDSKSAQFDTLTFAMGDHEFTGVLVSTPDQFPAIYVASARACEAYKESMCEGFRNKLFRSGVRVKSDDGIDTLVLGNQFFPDEDVEDEDDHKKLLRFYVKH